ncbi:MAG: SRPBCC family protein [Ignavibacteriaceae bacterium]|nr:SRPBCC family protein [Ignavibacteriaceae bacterium]
MSGYQFSVSKLINTTPKVVYSIIADYKDAHPKILPRPPFISLVVEQGGYGAGTVATVLMKVMGKIQAFRTIVSEPEQGRVLVETNDTGYITTFTIEPRDDDKNSFVTFTTEIPDDSTIIKKLEFRLSKLLLIPVYKKELENLADFASERS